MPLALALLRATTTTLPCARRDGGQGARVPRCHDAVVDEPGRDDALRGQGVVGPLPVAAERRRHREHVGRCEGAGGPADEGIEDVAVGVDRGVLGAEIYEALGRSLVNI